MEISASSAAPATHSIDVAAAWQEVGSRLQGFVRRRVPQADADDIVQSVMLRLLEKRDDVAHESLRGWLFAVTRNAVAEHYRRDRGLLDLDSVGEVALQEELDVAEASIQRLAACLDPMLATLPELDAELLRRVELDGRTQTELAQELGAPLSTVKSRVQRARTKLRAAFDACCEIEVSREGAPISIVPRKRC